MVARCSCHRLLTVFALFAGIETVPYTQCTFICLPIEIHCDGTPYTLYVPAGDVYVPVHFNRYPRTLPASRQKGATLSRLCTDYGMRR